MLDKNRVLLHAQLDLVMLVEYLVGVRETFNIDAAIETLREISEITGDPVGKELLELKSVDVF